MRVRVLSSSIALRGYGTHVVCVCDGHAASRRRSNPIPTHRKILKISQRKIEKSLIKPINQRTNTTHTPRDRFCDFESRFFPTRRGTHHKPAKPDLGRAWTEGSGSSSCCWCIDLSCFGPRPCGGPYEKQHRLRVCCYCCFFHSNSGTRAFWSKQIFLDAESKNDPTPLTYFK